MPELLGLRLPRPSRGVIVLRPRATRVRLWLQRVTPLCALLAAGWGGVNAYQQQLPAYRGGLLSRGEFMRSIGGAMAVDGAAGALAACSGGLAYANFGGGTGLVLGAAAFAVAGFGGHQAPGVAAGVSMRAVGDYAPGPEFRR